MASHSAHPSGTKNVIEKDTDMKRLLVATALSVAAIPALAADVGVSITIGEPGFYGRIDLGSAPRPEVVYAEPVVVAPVTVVREPVYLVVPPAHQTKWSKYCRSYNACGQPVYFVQQGWYDNVYVPHHRERHGKGKHGKHKD